MGYLKGSLKGKVKVGPQGVDSAYERGGDARREFYIKLLKEERSGQGPSFF